MKKVILVIALVVVVGLGVGIWWLARSLDSLVEAAIEKYGSELTGTEVAVDGVEIGVRDGSGAIDGLTIANPDGFSDGTAVSLGRGSIRVDPGTLRSDPVVVEEILISTPRLLLELDGSGKTNLGVLKDRVQSATAGSGGGGAGSGGGTADAPRLRVASFRFEEGTVVVDATALGGDRSERTLPAVRLTDIGGANGAPAPEIGQAALQALLDQAVKQAATDELRERLDEELEERGGVEGVVSDLLGGNGE
jgi:hypothetical protein